MQGDHALLFTSTVTTSNNNVLEEHTEEPHISQGDTLVRLYVREKKKKKTLPQHESVKQHCLFFSHVFVLYIAHTLLIRRRSTVIFASKYISVLCFLPVHVKIELCEQCCSKANLESFGY